VLFRSPTPPILIVSPKPPLTLHSTYIRFPHRMRGINLVASTMLPYLTLLRLSPERVRSWRRNNDDI